MRLLITLTALFMQAEAHNKNQSADFEVIGAKPTDPDQADAQVMAQMTFNPDIGTNVSDEEISSDWSYIRCGVRDNHVYAVFTAKVSNWPTSWPSVVTCRKADPNGGADFVLTLNLKNIDPVLDAYGYDWTPSSPAVIPIRKTNAKGTGDSAGRTFRLPNGTWKVPATYTNAKRSDNTVWPEVYCGVYQKPSNSKFYLDMVIHHDSGGGDGYCQVKKIGSGWQKKFFRIDRL